MGAGDAWHCTVGPAAAARKASATVAGPGHAAARQLARAAAGQAAEAQAPGLAVLAHCLQPLLLQVVEFLVERPWELAQLQAASQSVEAELREADGPLWEGLYGRRWPAFHDCLRYLGRQNWRGRYRETFEGKFECTLEVFDREKKLGFAMAAMAARVTYEAGLNVYVTKYLSASEILPELIPALEEHRLRFCPPSARDRLQPALPPAEVAPRVTSAKTRKDRRCRRYSVPVSIEGKTKEEAASPDVYPYRVLPGVEGLVPGQAVELQWKMQYGSPFGWWYGHLEELRLCKGEEERARWGPARATITFRHFPSNSRWYRLEVGFGDADMRQCDFGGYTGGIRAATEAEERHWMIFFPKQPVFL